MFRGVINNACPRCGWFSSDIDEWPRWDGQLSEEVDLGPVPNPALPSPSAVGHHAAQAGAYISAKRTSCDPDCLIPLELSSLVYQRQLSKL
jgi:hypothetical protein